MAKAKRISSASEIVEYRPKPSLHIDDRDLKAVKDMKVGDTCTFTVTAKVKSISQGDEYGPDDDEDKRTRARLQITKITEK